MNTYPISIFKVIKQFQRLNTKGEFSCVDGALFREDGYSIVQSLAQLRNMIHHRRPTGLTDRLIHFHAFSLAIDVCKFLGELEEGEHFIRREERINEKVYEARILQRIQRKAKRRQTSRSPPPKKTTDLNSPPRTSTPTTSTLKLQAVPHPTNSPQPDAAIRGAPGLPLDIIT
jgi:hypothetical protein